MLFTPRNTDAAHTSKNDASDAFFKERVQTKLAVGQPGDKYEVEADRTADTVVSKLRAPQPGAADTPGFFSPKPAIQPKKQETVQPKESGGEDQEIQEKPLAESLTPLVQLEPEKEAPPKTAETSCAKTAEELDKKGSGAATVQKKCADCEAKEKAAEKTGGTAAKCDKCEEEQRVQKKEGGTAEKGNELESRLSASKGRGAGLDDETREEMNHGFGSDFSNVRVHTDADAVRMNKELGSQAFTNGNDIYFNEGKYDTSSDSGRHLLAHELTHTIQQGGGASENKVQQKPDDYAHPEDGEQSTDGMNAEVKDELGDDKDIRHPKLTAEERSQPKPPAEDKGKGVDKGELKESAKPNADRKKEAQPKINTSVKQTKAAIKNVQKPPVPKEKKPKKKGKKLSPKELAAARAKQAFAKAAREPERFRSVPVKPPTLRPVKDAAGNELPGNPAADAHLVQLTARIQVMRDQANVLRERADRERLNAEELRAYIQVMYNSVFISDEYVSKANNNTDIRKEGVEQLKVNLEDSKARTAKVEAGLPAMQEQTAKGAEETAPVAKESAERTAATNNVKTDDPDAKKDAEERGKELNSADSDTQAVGDVITQAVAETDKMALDLVTANQQNAEATITIAGLDTSLTEVKAKLGASEKMNTSAKRKLDVNNPKPNKHLREAEKLDQAAEAKIERSEELEKTVQSIRDEYVSRMAGVQPDASTSGLLQRKEETGAEKTPALQMQSEDPNVKSPGELRQEESDNWYKQRVKQLDDELVNSDFSEMDALDKASWGLNRAYLDIRGDLSNVNWTEFTEEMIESMVNPVTLVESMGEMYKQATNTYRESDNPLMGALRGLAGAVTGISIAFATILGLCLIGYVGLGILCFWFPPNLIWAEFVFIELAGLMAWAGTMLLWTAAIAVILHALVFIGNLLATAFSTSACQLIDNSKDLEADAKAAAFPVITIATAGLFKTLGKVGGKFGLKPKGAPGETIPGETPVETKAGATETAVPNETAPVGETTGGGKQLAGGNEPVTTKQSVKQTTGKQTKTGTGEPTELKPVEQTKTTKGPKEVETTGETVNETKKGDANKKGSTTEEVKDPVDDTNTKQPNNEGAGTVDGLKVESEFKGNDGHTRKVLEDGQVARCTFCERCRETYKDILKNEQLSDQLKQLEEAFDTNPNDLALQEKQLKFEENLKAIRDKQKTIEEVIEEYDGGSKEKHVTNENETTGQEKAVIEFDRNQVGRQIDRGTQAKHDPNSNAYKVIVDQKGKYKSIMTQDPQILLDRFHAGEFKVISNSEGAKSLLIDFGEEIGIIVEENTGVEIGPARYGSIKYGNKVHITPQNVQ